MLAARKLSTAAPALPSRRVAPAPRLVCRAAQNSGEQKEDRVRQALAVPLATMAAAALLTGAFFPDEALAARSSGRAGGSSGFSSRKSYSRPSTSSTTMRSSTTVVAPSVIVAPPVYSPFGFGGYGGYGGGYGFMPSFVMPFSFLGSLFQIFFLMAIVSVVFSVVSGFANSAKKDDNKKDDDWGNL